MGMPRVAVVGGSIGGLTAAALLRDAGCEVDVYERTPVPLSGYGGGIVVQPDLVRYFLERTDITLDHISVPSSAIRYFNAGDGTLIGEVELRFASGRVVRCELAVCANGGFSTARQRLLGIVPKYAGYITWRGLAGRSVLSDEAWDFFDGRFTYGLLDDSHIIAYPIPALGDDFRIAGRSPCTPTVCSNATSTSCIDERGRALRSSRWSS